jgi:hypothetical protein
VCGVETSTEGDLGPTKAVAPQKKDKIKEHETE